MGMREGFPKASILCQIQGQSDQELISIFSTGTKIKTKQIKDNLVKLIKPKKKENQIYFESKY